MEQQQHMFSNRMICSLLIPVVLEQLLNSIMGTADTHDGKQCRFGGNLSGIIG